MGASRRAARLGLGAAIIVLLGCLSLLVASSMAGAGSGGSSNPDRHQDPFARP